MNQHASFNAMESKLTLKYDDTYLVESRVTPLDHAPIVCSKLTLMCEAIVNKIMNKEISIYLYIYIHQSIPNPAKITLRPNSISV